MASRRRLTRDPRIWFQYACWCAQNWMRKHPPILPRRVRVWALNRWGNERFHLSPQTVAYWRQLGWTETPKPIPWPIGMCGFGPFVGPWNRVAGLLRSWTGGRSHRCEFTDHEKGALYGHSHGAFMDQHFEALLDNIEADEAETSALARSRGERQ